MTPNNTFFQQDGLEEQLASLAQTEGQPPTTPTSRAYSSLRQFHAAQARQEAQAIERVRLRLAARASSPLARLKSQHQRAFNTVSYPLPAQRLRHISQLRVWLNTAAAVLVVGLLVGGFVALLHARQIGASSSSINQYTWQVMPSPNTSLPINALHSISLSSSVDGWAVGQAANAPASALPTKERPLVEHWDGQHWQIVSTPTLPYGGNLFDVVSLAPDNAWAVGNMISMPGTADHDLYTTALIEHWDGHQWTVAPSPTIATGSSNLNKLAALAADDIWAVGSVYDNITPSGTLNTHGLIEHWNGQQWQIIVTPSQSADEQFNSITALAPDNIWAAGYSRGSDQQPVQPLVEHWNGSQWSIVPSPNPAGTSPSVLTGISAVSANDIWAAGVTTSAAAANKGPACCYAALLEHWDGQRWSIVASPSSGMVILRNIIALGPDNIWAIGDTWKQQTTDGQAQGLIEHWDGQRWSVVASPHPRGYISLSGVASDPSAPGKLWIVGSAGSQNKAYDGLSNATFIESGM